ncbi:putative small integral membrane protein [Nocardiopsis arvandica]|uniref:Putative small integral membrane protein n=1 Tax=Nocardiopsis sinuspersici TaxID=501010 RepID=A0A7Z0BMQ8_9ACTN|nr:DUF2165 family protein [Nocardiopsis sinuspersici]NYH55515.1 putative small integral membrane protein [Nocardiopsis sinuspersici]
MMVQTRRASRTGPRSAREDATGLLYPQTLVLGGMAAWLSLIMFNNITDSGTNITLIGQVLTMEGIIADPDRGNGLVGRALPGSLAAPALYAVIAYQALSVLLLWTATVAHTRLLLGRGDGTRATFLGNIALCSLAGLALMFLVGGLWFGYWIALPPVQQVHFTLLIIAIGAMVLINMPRTVRPADGVT